VRHAHARQESPALARRSLSAALAVRKKMLDEKEVRIETERSVDDVVRRLNEAIACNHLRAGLQPRLVGTVTSESVVLRRYRPMSTNSGYPVFHGSIRRVNGKTVIEGKCRSQLNFVGLAWVGIACIALVGMWQAIATQTIALLFGVIAISALAALGLLIGRHAMFLMLMGDVELLVKEVNAIL